jgi:polyisoprenoid-binding protein YceI
MKKIFLVLFMSCITLAGRAQLYTVTEGSAVSFFSEAPLENIEANNTKVSSFLNISNNEIMFIVHVRGFEFQKDLMKEHFNEKYMESDKYPTSTFKGKINDQIDYTKDGTYSVTATGMLTIHGVEREINAPGTVTVDKGKINIKSDFRVPLKGFKIEVPKLVFQNIAEVISIKVNINYIPYKKK